MELYISEIDEHLNEINEIVKKVDIVKNLADSTDVLIVPGGMGAFNDISEAVKLGKNLLLYDKDNYFSSIKSGLSRGHIITDINELQFRSNDKDSDINYMMEDKENEDGKINDGKISKLL